MHRLATTLLLLALAVPSRAERLRVVIAAAGPEVSAAALHAGGVRALRAGLIDSIPGASRVETWGDGPAFAAEIERETFEALANDPRVRAIEIDTGGRGALLESVALIGANALPAAAFDGTGATIAVLDSGVDLLHPAFAGRVVDEHCYCENFDGTGCCRGGQVSLSGPGSADDDHGHGTHVAGIAAGASQPRGVAPGARLVVVKVLDAEARFTTFTQIYRALDWIVRNRPDVRAINMSLGSDSLFAPGECQSSAVAIGLTPLLTALRERGVVIVASTGNSGQTSRMALPACIPNVLSVGATYDAPGNYQVYCPAPNAEADQVACFSNGGESLDIVAPGAWIASAWKERGTRTLAGTSMAAPHVTGVIAMMLQASGGVISAPQIEQILTATGKPLLDQRTARTVPRLDAAAALAATPRVAEKPHRRAVRH